MRKEQIYSAVKTALVEMLSSCWGITFTKMHIFRAIMQRLARIRRFVHSPDKEKSVPKYVSKCYGYPTWYIGNFV